MEGSLYLQRVFTIKVIKQFNSHKSNIYFLILGCKFFAANYNLKTGTQQHHQAMSLLPSNALK